ncbi:MAG: hypothetical protein KKE94_16505 [Gammaproteobacteria bacterium]|nr:hypothetical protein [Gammaproteobacteria bacterium]
MKTLSDVMFERKGNAAGQNPLISCVRNTLPDLDDIPSAVRAEILRKRFLGQTRSITLSLMTSLRINPLERLLVPVCGKGDESDNTEAVLYWVRRYACCASCIRTLSFYETQKDFLRFLINKTGQEYVE